MVKLLGYDLDWYKPPGEQEISRCDEYEDWSYLEMGREEIIIKG